MSRRGWVSAGGLALLLVASGVVSATTPTETQWEQPFSVPVDLGERGVGSDIAATVHEVTTADEIDDGSWASGDGSLWVLVDVSVEGVHEATIVLTHAALVVGERMYTASDRPPESTMVRTGLRAGIPERGVLAFEVPGDVLDDPDAASADLQLAAGLDVRLDSMIVTTIDLTALERASSLSLGPDGWSP